MGNIIQFPSQGVKGSATCNSTVAIAEIEDVLVLLRAEGVDALADNIPELISLLHAAVRLAENGKCAVSTKALGILKDLKWGLG